MAANPRITVTPHANGWLATCTASGCGWERWQEVRQAVDTAASKHQGGHEPTTKKGS